VAALAAERRDHKTSLNRNRATLDRTVAKR
jgi:hypothetical protein